MPDSTTLIVPPAGDKLLLPLENACRMLAEAKTVGEAKQIRDQALAIGHYLAEQRYSRDAQNDAAEIKLRAERKIGELLAETVENHRPGKYRNDAILLPDGINKDASHRWQMCARVPEEAFVRHVAEVRAAGGDLTTSGVLELARQLTREEARQAKRARRAVPATPPDPNHCRIDCADCLSWLRSLPADYFQLLLFSPPYEDARKDLGFPTYVGEEWVRHMVEVMKESLRVCTGVVCCVVEGVTEGYDWSATPALLMADLKRAGVHLRKPPAFVRYGIPGSGGPDWFRNDYEFCICATRGERLPWSDNTVMGHKPIFGPGGAPSHRQQDGTRVNGYASMEERARLGPHRARANNGRTYVPPDEANPGNVIHCGAAGGGNIGNELAHENEAPFPEDLVEFFIRSCSAPGGLVGDLFSGSGTTAAVAVRWGRRFHGCEYRQDQVDLGLRRVAGEKWAECRSVWPQPEGEST
jgi:hypothetical protein